MFALTFLATRDKKKTTRQHLKSLLALAKIDGLISGSEVELIFNIGEKNGIPREETELLIEDTDYTEAIVPDNDSERFDQIFNFVQLMLVDGTVDEKEIDFCITMAETLGFRKAIVGVLVRKISMNLAAGKLNREGIKNDVGNFLVYK
jgi:hypothetical protein